MKSCIITGRQCASSKKWHLRSIETAAATAGMTIWLRKNDIQNDLYNSKKQMKTIQVNNRNVLGTVTEAGHQRLASQCSRRNGQAPQWNRSGNDFFGMVALAKRNPQKAS